MQLLQKEQLKNLQTAVWFSLVLGAPIAAFQILGAVLVEMKRSACGAGVALRTAFAFPFAKGMAACGLAFLLWWIGIAVVLTAVLTLTVRLRFLPEEGKLPKIFAKPGFYTLLVVLCWIPGFLAYYPAIYSYDGEPQLIQYTMQAFDNHHPILHTLFIGKCYDLGQNLMARGISVDGMAFYSIVQILVLAGALHSGFALLIRKKKSLEYILAVTAFFALFPVHPLMAVSTTKDTMFAALFLMAVLQLIDILEQGETMQGRIKLAGSLILCMFLRRNGLYVFALTAVVFSVAALISYRKKNGLMRVYAGICGVLLASIVLFHVGETGLMEMTHAVQGESAEALSVPIQQIARSYKSHEAEFPDDLRYELYEYLSQEALANYRPYISDGVKMYFNNEKFGEAPLDFVKLYAKIGKTYPESYVTALLYQTLGDWYLMDTSHCEVYLDWWRDRSGYLITDAVPVFEGYDFVHKENLLPGARDFYESFATACSYRTFFPLRMLCAPALYVWATVIAGLWFVVKRNGKAFCVWCMLFAYLATELAGPCVLVRYIYPLMIVLPFLGAFPRRSDRR